MKPPKPSEKSEPDLAQEIEELEQWLRSLQERYHQVQRDQQQKAKWQEKLQQLQDNQHGTAEIKSEIERIQQQLLLLETNLESQLFSWTSLKILIIIEYSYYIVDKIQVIQDGQATNCGNIAEWST